jgi:hypothetical protein
MKSQRIPPKAQRNKWRREHRCPMCGTPGRKDSRYIGGELTPVWIYEVHKPDCVLLEITKDVLRTANAIVSNVGRNRFGAERDDIQGD